jgi:tetratricopeptide (TPR) repeat protein
MNETAVAARQSAYVLLQLDRPEEALEALGRDFDAEDPWSWHARAAALLALDRYGDAAKAAEEGLARDPEEAFLFDALASARTGLKDYAGAEEAILAALRLDSEDADYLTRYAHIAARAGQMEKAEKLVLRALSVDPENAFALQMHALLATAQGDRAAMIARSKELLHHLPENALGHRLLGAAHADGGSMDAAADHLRRAVWIDPTDNDGAEAVRDARIQSHWLLWPLRPLMRWGAAPVWIAAVGTMFTLRAMNYQRALSIVLVVWLVYCVYSWVVPPFVRRLARRRH